MRDESQPINNDENEENLEEVMEHKMMAPTVSGSVANHTYRVGEFVYMDTKGAHPYLIRRIEEFTKKENAPNDVRVTIVYRRRDISTAILRVADAAERHWPDYVVYDESTGEEVTQQKPKTEVMEVDEDEQPPALSPKPIPTPELNGQAPKKENGMDKHPEDEIKEELPDEGEVQGESEPKEPVIKKEEEQPFDWGLGGLPYDAAKLSEHERYRLRQREVFLSRKEEKLSASYIRGRCNVNLLCDVETSDDYLSRDDSYFYSLVYDNEKLSMLADKGAIRVGSQYQAVVPEFDENEGEEHQQNGQNGENGHAEKTNGDVEEENKENGDLMIDDGEGEEPEAKKEEPMEEEPEIKNRELDIYKCDNGLSENDIDRYLIHVRAIGVFARVIDPNSATKYPSAQMIAAIASKDSTILYAMGLLHQAGYDIAKAQDYLVPPADLTRFPVRMEDDMGFNTVTLGGPLLVRDQLEEYSAAESALFEEGLERIGKDFADIRNQLLPWKSLASLVEYYYLFKTTNRYIDGRKKRLAIEKDARILHTYIPGVLHDTSFVIGTPNNNQDLKMPSEKGCTVCNVMESFNWYKWGHRNDDAQLCHDCWQYWRHYGGSKTRNKLDHFDTDIAADPDVAQELLKTLSYATPSCSKTAKDPKRYGANSYTMYTVVSAADINAAGNPGAIANQKKPPTNMRVNLFTRMMRRAIPNSILSIKRVGRQPFNEVNLGRLFSYISNMDQARLCEVMKSIIAPNHPITPTTFQTLVGGLMAQYLSNNKRPASAPLEGQPPLKKAPALPNLPYVIEDLCENPRGTAIFTFLSGRQFRQRRRQQIDKMVARRIGRRPLDTNIGYLLPMVST